MAQAIIHELASNAAILLVLSFLYVQIHRRWEDHRLLGRVLNGFLFGAVAVGVMLSPLHLLPGVVFDTRSVVISVGGLFGGPLTAAVAFAMASAFRIWQGGAGTLMGVLVSFCSAALGVGYFYWKRRNPRIMTALHLYAFGLLVHLVMLVCALALPGATTWRVLETIALPVIIIYPLATLLIALLIRDMEAQIDAGRRLQASEERYRRIVNTANEGIWVINPANATVFANQKMAEMLGCQPEEMVGRPITDFIPPMDLPIHQRQMEVRREGGSDRYERRFRRKDGSLGWALISAAPLYEDGVYAGSLAMYTDISARKQAEEALRANQKRLEAILEASADPVVVYDTDGLTTYVNPAFTRVFGWQSQEVLGRRIPYVPPDQQEQTAEAIRQLYQTGGPVSLQTKRLTKRGESLDIVISAASIHEPDGRITGMVVNLTDVTHTNRLEAQLRQSQKMEAIGTLAGGIAHDFNNILGAIMGYAELALQTAQEGGDNRQELEQVLQATERARNLVKQILTFSRKAESDLRPLNLNQSVRQVLNLLEPALPKMVRIETRLDPELDLVRADATQMEQVLLNLAGNAADAMPEGGRLLIETQNLDLSEDYCDQHLDLAPGRHVLLMVSDTGVGMTPQVMEHIFDPFFTTKGVGRGTGLGLSTVFGIVKGHGGAVTCYSEPGLGTTFKIFLPVFSAEAPLRPTAQPKTRHPLGGGETILLVDDETSLRELGRQSLEGMGYRVLTASSGEEALATYQARGAEIDLVVLDLGMPGMGGHKCLQAILALNPRAKVVIASGYSANGQVKQSLESGAAGYVAKPFRRVELLRTLRGVLDGR
ncbi:MAG: PAS domain S-box protein [Desulfarculus sp.]|nr:PAS domain S-box protein [Desulfarculus sp.]